MWTTEVVLLAFVGFYPVVTAALWMELTAPTWHERTADVVMLGVALSVGANSFS